MLWGSLSAKPKFEGSLDFQFSGNNRHISLKTSVIVNRASTSSGTIRVALWATEKPYRGGKLKGTRVASFKLKGLAPGKSWNDVSRDLQTKLPPLGGHYYMTMTLEEFYSEGYRITDWMTFEDRVFLRGGSSRKTEPVINMAGPFKWDLQKEKGGVQITTGTIKHSRKGKTGSLRIIAWVTQEPYEGGEMRGYIIGHAELKPLEKGMMYPETNFLVRYQEPPRGSYFVTLTLSEWDGEGYVIMDHYTFREGAVF